MVNKVGIIILNFNSSDLIELTLNSIARAKTNIEFEISVIDNGSTEKEERKCREITSSYFEDSKRLNGFYICSKNNLGFSGGNNLAIKKFLEDSSISHICLLNSDVIVTDYWLDYLIKDELDVTGPVTNAAGNEQTIMVDYSVTKSISLFETVNSFSRKRHTVYLNSTNDTDILYFFCVVIKREVFERIGLLDEQFFPGSYEDNDLCIRMLNADYKLTVIRDCFVHHFGSGSFSKLEMPERVNISNVNRQRFEKKWNVKCKDTSWKLALSCQLDIGYFSGKEADPWAISLLEKSLKNVEELVDNLGNLRSVENTSSVDEIDDYPVVNSLDYTNGKTLLKLATKKAVIKILRILRLSPKLSLQDEANGENDVLYKEMLSQNTQRKKMICFFAPIFDKTNERDGYFQRIKAIDTDVFQDYFRIYLFDDNSRLRKPKIQRIDDDKVFILFDSHNGNQREQIFTLVKECGVFYTHSLLRFMPDSVDQRMINVFNLNNVIRIWDVHGSVPEEFLLNGDSSTSRIAGDVEKYIYNHSDVIITVTESMKSHLEDKYGTCAAKVFVLPIFNKTIIDGKERFAQIGPKASRKPKIVYAGGLQKWQNVELMQNLILKTMDRIDYRIFVPVPAAFLKLFGNKPISKNVVVDSKNPEEIIKEYSFCQYGLALRDDITVNNVACPTKIIEYIQNGIVPILKSPRIGDFSELGMEYLLYTQLLEGSLPSEKDRQEMVRHNLLVLKHLAEVEKKGKQDILATVNNLLAVKQDFLAISQDVEINESLPAIGLVVSQFDKGGLEQAVFNLYEGYRKHGYRTYILCQSKNIGYFARKLNSPDDLFVFDSNSFQFISFCKRKNIKWLHYHYNTFLIRLVKVLRIHTIYSIHNIYSWLSDQEIKQRSKLINSADHIVAVSTFTKEYYCKRTGTPDSRVAVISNGVDTEELDAKKLDGEFTRSSLGFQKDDIILGFIASFHQVKHQMNMVGAMEEIIKVNPKIKLVFVGNIGHASYFRKVKGSWEKSSARQNVFYIPFIDHSQIGEFLRESVDIFILPTIQEGCSNAVIEALYCGKPMLLTNVGNASDLVHLKSVVVVDRAFDDLYSFRQSDIAQICLEKKSRNNSEIVNGVLEIAEHLEDYKQAARDAARLYENQCDKSVMVDHYLGLIQSQSSKFKKK
jgi:GT2 family glycosyltransferase/glycosyltransferase involved in cell wall biosynthesis